ncbi:hypothetical protein, partial [Comamonas thiooxydans]|uniref:hypothetical protein n=4 Tax=Comamonas thiooxydans TaxID=363952 RepID=UPI0019D6F6A0
AVVNVTDGAHVHVGLGTFELFFCHDFSERAKTCVMFKVCTSLLTRPAQETGRHGIADRQKSRQSSKDCRDWKP